MAKGMKALLPQELIENKIYLIRGEKVMLDQDLAKLYGVPTHRLNEQVKRNIKRFPADFMFRLDYKEFSGLISQFAISKSRGGRRKMPYAFTENGVAMLSSVLNSDRAVQVNIQIMRTFTPFAGPGLARGDLNACFGDVAACHAENAWQELVR
jgi:ORF6N domain